MFGRLSLHRAVFLEWLKGPMIRNELRGLRPGDPQDQAPSLAARGAFVTEVLRWRSGVRSTTAMTAPSLPEEAPFLAVVRAMLAKPGDEATAKELCDVRGRLPHEHRLSAQAIELLNELAARRRDLPRDALFVLVPALCEQRDAKTLDFLLDLLPDPGFSGGAIDALERFDPEVAAPALRAWLAANNNAASSTAFMLRALRTKMDLASPASEGAPIEIDGELLEYWMHRGELDTLRRALATGLDPSTPVSYGETLLHSAIDRWEHASPESGGSFGLVRDDWVTFVGDLLKAGADPERKLGYHFNGRGDLGWSKGSSARKMLEYARKTSLVSPEECDRLEAVFPTKTSAKKRPPPASR